MKHKPGLPRRFLLACLLFLLLLSASAGAYAAPPAQTDDEATIPPPDLVAIAGTFQTQLGCPGDWNTDCEATYLAYDPEDDLWIATFELEAGDYEYKAALNGTWADNYGLNAEYYGPNIPLEVAAAGPVTFFYDHKTRWVSDNVNSFIANVPGDFQEEIGCPGDWQPDCLRSLLQDPDGDGLYQFLTASIPPGDYEAKVAFNQSWELNFGADGAQDGPNIPFSVPEDAAVIFTYNPASYLLEISLGDASLADGMISGGPAGGSAGMPPPAAQKPDTVTIPGTIQSALGCPGDWQPECDLTYLNWDADDQLWQATFDIPAGDYEYKAALNDSWEENFGLNAESYGPNIPLALAEDTAVSFYFDHVTGWVTDDVNAIIANVPGDFQDEIGCPGEWQPDCLRSWLQDPDGDGFYEFKTLAIPAGDYEAKVAINQSWAENYGEGGAQDGPNIPFNVPAGDTLVTFTYDSRSHVMAINAGEAGGAVIAGNIGQAKAHWVTADTIAWDIETAPGYAYTLHYATNGALQLGFDGLEGGETIPLTYDEAGLSDDILAKFPHLRRYAAFKISPDDMGQVRIALTGQLAVSAVDETGAPVDATGLQIPGVLDDLYTYNGPLGVTYDGDAPTLRVWAPTARSVKLHLFPDSSPNASAGVSPMRVDPDTGVWSITGAASWTGQYYLYEVEVYAPATGAVEHNLVTDPYSYSLSTNSQRSQIVNLADPALMPAGWLDVSKPPLAAPEDIVVYEMHIRDFSINDTSVSEANRGTYLAFTETEANGMKHLINLAQAGVTHLHLLPAFDIATIEEDASARVDPDAAVLASFPPDSPEQQALIGATRDQDGFNWGYDPFHYTVPEGSYATDPDGPARILEFRQMVQSLNENGLRVVLDVVYNHTSASGQSTRSVLDRIVPGYYHRLSATGKVETSTCCQNTATEHNMMRKLMVDSAVTWATAYKIDAFRFDLMGHHMLADMLAVRAALDSLTLAKDGVDGSSIYIYGEGWNFGEVANDARGVNATQFNTAGTGIGTFNDRLRDAVRGGNPFGGHQEQGFINGLYYDPNETDQGSEGAQLARLLLFADQIRVGLAGNLAGYEFIGAMGGVVAGKDVDYNGSPAGYTHDPQENIVYISKHDNETLFDIIQFKAPLDSSVDERVRMQNMGLSIVSLSQGVPFFHAGSDMLRSKSLDRNSYNSGDWFNRLDFTYETNNWGVGLPPAGDNESNWPIMAPLLGMEGITPARDDILKTVAHFQEMMAIRRSSPLFRLQTADQIQNRLQFHNTGPGQIPGLIVMSLSDMNGENLDPNYAYVVTLFNASDEEQSFTIANMAGLPLQLHPVQVNSADPVVTTAAFDPGSGTFTIPARTTAVFVLADADAPAEVVAAEVEEVAGEETAETPTTAAVEEVTGAETAATPAAAAAEATPTEAAAVEEAPPAATEPETAVEKPVESNWIVWAGAAVAVVVAAVAGLLVWRRRPAG